MSRRCLAIAALAPLALLAACGGAAEEEQPADAALDAAEVDAAMADADFLPRPGEYRTTQELIAFDLPGLPESQMAMVRAAFAEGAAEPTTICVTEQMSREQWLSDMAESNCTLSRFEAEGGRLDVAMTCAAADGITGDVAVTGTATPEGSDLEMTFTQSIPDMGEGTIRMRLASERTGECA